MDGDDDDGCTTEMHLVALNCIFNLHQYFTFTILDICITSYRYLHYLYENFISALYLPHFYAFCPIVEIS